MALESERLMLQLTQLFGLKEFTLTTLKSVGRQLKASLSVYDCVHERVQVLLTVVNTRQDHTEVLQPKRAVAEDGYSDLSQEVIGLRGEREELKDAIEVKCAEWEYVSRAAAIETAFYFAQRTRVKLSDISMSKSVALVLSCRSGGPLYGGVVGVIGWLVGVIGWR